jgi:geranylgeranyl pyrophosphate synthase
MDSDKLDAISSDGNNQLALQTKALLFEKGHKALETAKQLIKDEKIPDPLLTEAITYFMSNWDDVLHPALLALTCEAVEGNADSVVSVGVAYVLLAGGADVHDDVIDNSTSKYSKETVFGKYGKDIAILVGDALLVEGFFALQQACATQEAYKKEAIFAITKQAFFGISSAQVQESVLKQHLNSPAEQYFSMLKTKASVASATARIGAILGDGSEEQVAALAAFGETFGLLLSVRDEFIDVYDLEELKHRVENEWLPLPILYALQKRDKTSLDLDLSKDIKENYDCFVDLVSNSDSALGLKDAMEKMITDQEKRLSFMGERRSILISVLLALIENL